MSPSDIQPGTLLRVRDADGVWHEKVATSAVEGTHDDSGKRVHNFPGVYATYPQLVDQGGVFYPLEDVEIR